MANTTSTSLKLTSTTTGENSGLGDKLLNT